MTNRNPFRIIEKIGRIAGYTLMAFFIVVAFASVIYVFVDKYEMGWWGLLLIPGIPLALLVVTIVFGLIASAGRWVEDRWDDAKYKWDNKTLDKTRDE